MPPFITCRLATYVTGDWCLLVAMVEFEVCMSACKRFLCRLLVLMVAGLDAHDAMLALLLGG